MTQISSLESSKGIAQSQILWIIVIFFLILVAVLVSCSFFAFITRWVYRRKIIEHIRVLNETQRNVEEATNTAELQTKLAILIAQLQQNGSRDAKIPDYLLQAGLPPRLSSAFLSRHTTSQSCEPVKKVPTEVPSSSKRVSFEEPPAVKKSSQKKVQFEKSGKSHSGKMKTARSRSERAQRDRPKSDKAKKSSTDGLRKLKDSSPTTQSTQKTGSSRSSKKKKKTHRHRSRKRAKSETEEETTAQTSSSQTPQSVTPSESSTTNSVQVSTSETTNTDSSKPPEKSLRVESEDEDEVAFTSSDVSLLTGTNEDGSGILSPKFEDETSSETEVEFNEDLSDTTGDNSTLIDATSSFTTDEESSDSFPKKLMANDDAEVKKAPTKKVEKPSKVANLDETVAEKELPRKDEVAEKAPNISVRNTGKDLSKKNEVKAPNVSVYNIDETTTPVNVLDKDESVESLVLNPSAEKPKPEVNVNHPDNPYSGNSNGAQRPAVFDGNRTVSRVPPNLFPIEEDDVTQKDSPPKDSVKIEMPKTSNGDPTLSFNPYWRSESQYTTDIKRFRSPNTGRLQSVMVEAKENTTWYPPNNFNTKSNRSANNLSSPFDKEPILLPQKHQASFCQIRPK